MKKTRIAALLLTLALCLTLLPMAAMAEEAEEGEFTITFDADGGKFEDGSQTQDIPTHPGGYIMYAPDSPVREGYTFVDWGGMDYDALKYHAFTSNATVKATWKAEEKPNMTFNLNPNGGTVSPNYFEVDGDWKIVGSLPTPTRPGYTFQGWYIDGKLVDESRPLTSSAPFPVARWERTSKTSPSVSASPSKIQAGTEKVELSLACGGGAALDWRPLERILFGGGEPADVGAAVKAYINGNFDNVGLKLTGVKYQGDVDVNDSAYPAELYPEGVFPTPELVLTLEGKAVPGSLVVELAPAAFVQVVSPKEETTLTESSGQIFNAARVTVTVEGGAAVPSNPNGPFTVKYDLNYKNPRTSEIPKDQTVYKGNAVSLPDGGKLTPPSSDYAFYAWCVLGEDGKLFPWNEDHAVTGDMTLYAGWIRKGTESAAPSGSKPVEETSKKPETPKPAEPAAKPAFADVAATSPFAQAISWAVEQKITNGKTATAFGPGDPCTRAQIVTFLWRAAGSPEPKSMEAEYADVTNTGAYYYKAVQWAAEMGMEESGTFAPHDTCSRVTAVYFIWTAFGSPKAAAKASFEDVREPERGQWYWPDLPDAVDWAVEKGVTTGKTATTFGPGDPCTRGQIVTFLYRAYVPR